jgi:hypothetical protein
MTMLRQSPPAREVRDKARALVGAGLRSALAPPQQSQMSRRSAPPHGRVLDPPLQAQRSFRKALYSLARCRAQTPPPESPAHKGRGNISDRTGLPE